MISEQNKVIIGATKDDIKYMIQELKNIRNNECAKDFKNSGMEYVHPESSQYCISIKDFKPYRSMADTLIKTIDNLNRMCNHNSYDQHTEFIDFIFDKLNFETSELHKLKETCRGDHNQYRCLNDAYIKLTDKLCQIEKDKPEQKNNPVERNIELGLLKYQQDAVEFDGENLICDWARGAGKTFTIAKTIEIARPKNVLYIDGTHSGYTSLKVLSDKFIDVNRLNRMAGSKTAIDTIGRPTSTMLQIQVSNIQEDVDSTVNIYTLEGLKKGEVKTDTIFDYIFFAELLPYNVGVKSKHSISFISYNDKEEWLEKFYPHCRISKIDYKPLVEIGLLTNKYIAPLKDSGNSKFKNEFAILD